MTPSFFAALPHVLATKRDSFLCTGTHPLLCDGVWILGGGTFSAVSGGTFSDVWGGTQIIGPVGRYANLDDSAQQFVIKRAAK